MKADPNSVWALTYLDKDFAYKDGRHDVEKLILIGWLLTSHWSDETQARELWHIINPELRESVSKKEVNQVISQLMYIAVNLNTKFVNSMPDSSEKKEALAYLDTCQNNRKNWAINLT